MIKTKAELRADIEALELERRSFMEEVRHGTGEFNEEEAKSKLADFDKRRADLEKAYAEIDKPEGGKEGRAWRGSQPSGISRPKSFAGGRLRWGRLQARMTCWPWPRARTIDEIARRQYPHVCVV